MLWKGLMRCCSSSHTKNKSGEREKKKWKCNGLEMDERYSFFSKKYLGIKVENKRLQKIKTKKNMT